MKRAFTLPELLVAIAVIAILAALLFPVLSAAKARAQRTVCMNNLRQIDSGVRMYSDDSSDTAPAAAVTNSMDAFSVYKELMKNYVGLQGGSSSRDNLFACPADTFYYDYAFVVSVPRGYVPQSFCAQSISDYSSYSFNAGNSTPHIFYGTNFPEPGIAGMKLSSIKHPARTVLVAETAAFMPWSWHQPKRPFNANFVFDGSRNVVSFVDGHVDYIKMHWDSTWPAGTFALAHDPPAGYDYQWTGN